MKLRIAERFGGGVRGLEGVDAVEASSPGLFAVLIAYENIRQREEAR